jgi:hypothetical protein
MGEINIFKESFMASVRDLVDAGFDENLVKQAVDAAGFERKRGRGGLNLDAKGVAKVVKTYNALLAKLTAKAAKFNPDKLDYGTDDEAPATKAKTEKKPAPKAAKKSVKPVDDEDEDDEPVEEDDEVEEADDEEEDE